MAMLTIMGMYNFDNTIFDSMYLPTGVDRTKMIQNIILETAELETVYPAPSFFKSAVGLWSNCQAFTWDRIYSASQLEYDPIENYNRYESETTGSNKTRTGSDEGSSENSLSRTGSGNDSTVTDADKKTTVSATENRDTTTAQTTTNEIAGFDSAALVTHDKSTVSGTGSDDSTRSGTETETNDVTVTGTRSETVTEKNTTTNENSSTETLTDAGTRESHIHGNIGVTTSQQMLESELEVAPKLNIYSYITNEFKKRFCILVY